MLRPSLRLWFSLVLLALAVRPGIADEADTARLASFLSGKQYDITCFELVADERTTAIALKVQEWIQENLEQFRSSVFENEGKPLPYDPKMGISREDYEWWIENSQKTIVPREIPGTLVYVPERKDQMVTFRFVEEGGGDSKPAPRTIPYATNLMLISTRINLATTHLSLINFDAGKAEWITGESDFLGKFRGFRWSVTDDRLSQSEKMPEGEVAANVKVQMLYSEKHRKVYGSYRVATGGRDGLIVNSELHFWLTVRK